MMFDITKDSEHVYAMGIYHVLLEQSSAFSLTLRLNLFSIHRLVADDKECAVYVNLSAPYIIILSHALFWFQIVFHPHVIGVFAGGTVYM